MTKLKRSSAFLLWSFGMAFAAAGQGCGKDHNPRPSAPGHLVAVAADGRVSLSWGDSQGADSYTVKRSGTHRGPYIRIGEGIQLSAFTDHDVTNSRLHYYVVSASNRFGESGNSAEVMAVPLPTTDVPAAPDGLLARAEDDRIFLTWTGVPGATSYDVRRSDTSGGPFASVLGSPVNEPAYVDQPPAGATYYYVVTATNLNGTSPESNSASATPTTPVAPPPAPELLSADPGDTRISLSWKPCPGATGYNLKKASLPGGPYALVTKTTTPKATDVGLVNGVPWFYIVTAMNSAGESGPSDEIAAKAVEATAPPPPLSEVHLNSGSERVWLSWPGSPNAAGYRVRRGTASGAADTVVGEPDQPGFYDAGLSNGTVYYYVVTSFNSAGESLPGSEVSSRPAGQFPAPDGVGAYGGDKVVYLGWNAAPGATRYSIKKSHLPGGPYVPIIEMVDVQFQDNAVKNDVSYYYVVSALNSDGESINSNEVTATPTQSAGCAAMSPITLILTGIGLLLRKARRWRQARFRHRQPMAVPA